jgi:hypothetical protein
VCLAWGWRRAADLYPGDAKTDRRDAYVIADTARTRRGRCGQGARRASSGAARSVVTSLGWPWSVIALVENRLAAAMSRR